MDSNLFTGVVQPLGNNSHTVLASILHFEDISRMMSVHIIISWVKNLTINILHHRWLLASYVCVFAFKEFQLLPLIKLRDWHFEIICGCYTKILWLVGFTWWTLTSRIMMCLLTCGAVIGFGWFPRLTLFSILRQVAWKEYWYLYV